MCGFLPAEYNYKTTSSTLSLIDDILALRGKSKCFSTLDLAGGPEQRGPRKTMFTCHMGLFNFRVMPFGLANASGVFSQLMSIVLDGMETFAMAYLDDIMVSDCLKRHGLKLKLSKCQFLREETKYLGFVINKDGITDVDKVEVIKGYASSGGRTPAAVVQTAPHAISKTP